MKVLPFKWQWLAKEGAPKMLVEALRHYGIMEKVGKGSTADISAWAKELGVEGYYTDDDIPWCGLFVGVVAARCGYPFVNKNKLLLLGAANWAKYGVAVPKAQASLWDILIFVRPGGGHVGFYVGENENAYLVYGGNQSNAVGFAWIDKARCTHVRRPAYKIGVPPNVRPIHLSETGELSNNEA